MKKDQDEIDKKLDIVREHCELLSFQEEILKGLLSKKTQFFNLGNILSLNEIVKISGPTVPNIQKNENKTRPN